MSQRNDYYKGLNTTPETKTTHYIIIVQVACTKDQLRHLEARLSQAICLYKRRLEWLTSESRRIFGVMEEKSAVLVLDIKNMSPQQWNQYRSALERVIREQITQLAKFNIVR